VEGDGSLQVNVQELPLLLKHNIKLFVLNNGGYASIRNTQMSRFGRKLGCDEESGLNFLKVLREERINNNVEIESKMKQFMNGDSFSWMEVMINPCQQIRPRLQSTMNKDGIITPGRLEDVE
jgi:acetolactate synthase-1/2/3 large subunit